MNILLVISRGVLIVVGIFGKNFYSGDVFSYSVAKPEQRVSTWYGRILFFVVGGFLIAVGIKLLMSAE
jgi:outer membrane lipoprotein SlyB